MIYREGGRAALQRELPRFYFCYSLGGGGDGVLSPELEPARSGGIGDRQQTARFLVGIDAGYCFRVFKFCDGLAGKKGVESEFAGVGSVDLVDGIGHQDGDGGGVGVVEADGPDGGVQIFGRGGDGLVAAEKGLQRGLFAVFEEDGVVGGFPGDFVRKVDKVVADALGGGEVEKLIVDDDDGN